MTRMQEFAALLERCAATDAISDDFARQRLFDTLGAAAIGLHTDEGEAVQRLLGTDRRKLEAFKGEELLHLLCVATRCTEVDDINIDSCTTVGAVVIPAVLAAASVAQSATAADLFAGIFAGYEAMVRLGEAIDGASIIYKGIWPTYATAPFAAAAATSAVWKLSPEKTAHALSLSLARSSTMATTASGGVSPRSWFLGRASREGYASALAASAGIGGNGDEFAAFASRHGIALDYDILMQSGDRLPAIRRMDTKSYPTARQALSAIEAFRSLLPLPFSTDEIQSVRVRVPAQLRDMIARPPHSRIGSMVSVAYQMALAVFEPEQLYNALRITLPVNAAISQFTAKVVIETDPQLSLRYPAVWGSEVTILRASGPDISATVLHPGGSAGYPLGWQGLADKYVTLLGASKVGRTSYVQRLAQTCRQMPSPDGVAVHREIISTWSAVSALKCVQ